MERTFFLLFFPFSLSARLQSWHGLNPWQSTLFPITLFFLPFIYSLFCTSFFFFLLVSSFFGPLIYFSSFPLPSFLFAFSYSFPIPFLPPHSVSSSMLSFLIPVVFFPFHLVFFPLFPTFILFSWFLPFFFSPPISFLLFFSFSPLIHFVLFYLFHLFAKGAAVNVLK